MKDYMQKLHKIIADENIDYDIVKILREKNFDIFSILESLPSISDFDVLSSASFGECFLITNDKDFGELIYKNNLSHNGILLIRLGDMDREEKIKLVIETIIENFEKMQNHFCVLTNKQLRIR